MITEPFLIYETRYYAGIGSRKTPKHILDAMEYIAQLLHERNYILRSGGAIGADQAFERGSTRKEIYLPCAENPKWTEVFNMYFHPRPDRLTANGWNMMCRNAMQVLGRDGNTPVDFVVCWTKDGKDSGGTGQAIRIAQAFDIPVYNLYSNADTVNLSQRIADMAA